MSRTCSGAAGFSPFQKSCKLADKCDRDLADLREICRGRKGFLILEKMVNPYNRSMAISLKVGQVVQLKSGGPNMTVSGEEHIFGDGTGKVRCQWFEGTKMMQGTFPEVSLQIVEEGSGRGSMNVIG